MSFKNQSKLATTQTQAEIGILVFAVLTAIEFGINFGLIPLLSRLIIDPVLGLVISNFLMLGFILGILGFLTYSKISLLAGAVSSTVELLIHSFILFNSYIGLIGSEYMTQAAGIAILALAGLFLSIFAGYLKVDDITTVHTQVRDRKRDVVLEIKDLKKHYQISADIKVKALDGVSFSVKKGEMIAIMGPSGSGKSTLLNQLGLLDSPTSGEIILDGQDVSKMDALSLANERNSKIGFIFQSYNLLNRSSVLKNVELPSIVNFSVQKKERERRGKEFLMMLGLEAEIPRKPKTLSGGQQQRVAIARALMNNPSIILADEPTGNLDSKSGGIVMDVLKKLNQERGITVILVTHDREVANFADRILFLKDGKVESEKVLPKEIIDFENGEI